MVQTQSFQQLHQQVVAAETVVLVLLDYLAVQVRVALEVLQLGHLQVALVTRLRLHHHKETTVELELVFQETAQVQVVVAVLAQLVVMPQQPLQVLAATEQQVQLQDHQ
jgi:hypothetical protein